MSLLKCFTGIGCAKNIAIIIVLSGLVFGTIASTATWNFTAQHYQLIIKNKELEATAALQAQTQLTLIKERENEQITSSLNDKAAKDAKKIADLQKQINSYKSSDGGLYINGKCSSEAPTNVASGTTNGVVTGTTSSSNGLCELPKLFADFLIETTNNADQMRDNLVICKEYSEAIINQRNELSKQQ